MRLKHLNLFGFKTFAPKTDIQFGEGLTAIVGPNGSGKSNVADAIRWALGEQSLAQLRAKKTEDLIFAGSSNRAPLGMAEVSITIDNTDRLLPIDFAEVTITRRAYRSGENEYYINKSRVRLREVLEVASILGQAYTVVGQGLVDAALSARPEERRELFEEAAAIRGYFVQRDDALKRLTRTEENVARVNDLVAELEPQVRRMERQARQAQEYQKLEQELHTLLREWYAGRWVTATADLEAAQQAELASEAVVEERKRAAALKGAELAEVRARVWALVDDVSHMHEERAQLQSRHAASSQAQAVLAERITASASSRESLVREKGELASAIERLLEHEQSIRQDLDSRSQELAALEAEGKSVADELAALNSGIAALKQEQAQHNAQHDAVSRRVFEVADRIAAAQRLAAEHESAAAEIEGAIASLTQRIALEERALDERHLALSEAQKAVAAAEKEQRDAQAAHQSARAAQGEAELRRRESLKRAEQVQAQLAALIGEQQASLYGGVRAALKAARDGKLEGIVGTVAELFRVPSDLEVAVEAALGGRLQEIVTGTWSDAEQAIAFLKQNGAGRATFLPLDTIRGSRQTQHPTGPGIVGLASDLVDYDPEHARLADVVLGRLLIVEDLPSARRTLGSMQTGAALTIATLDGEVVRAGGAVTGGSNTRADDSAARSKTILARERRRRELQLALDGVRSELSAAERAAEGAIVAVTEADTALTNATVHLNDVRRMQSAAQIAHMEQQNAIARLQQELSWRTGLLSESRKNREAQQAAAAELHAQKVSLEAQIAPFKEAAHQLTKQLDELTQQREQIVNAAGATRTRIAVLSEGLRNSRTRLADLERERARHESRLAELKSRLEAASLEEADHTTRMQVLAAEVRELQSQVEVLEAQVGPAEKEVRVLEAEVSRIEGEQAELQSVLLESETLHSRAAVERQRCLGVLSSLTIEIEEELGARDDIAGGLDLAGAGALLSHAGANGWAGNGSSHGTAHQSTSSLPVPRLLADTPQPVRPGEDLDDLERRVRALKARLSRLGPVNALAPEEHAMLVERHTYLQGQLSDLLSAAEALRRVVAELDRTMREQFAVTFAQVNEAFQYFFTSLFSGGTARLELTNPNDVGASGIEIYAQPPGKRMQPLAALSGGERALTSVALLCSLLKVRPVPFCVLDEVDAALDESNVTRFRSALQELGSKTQFVVVTHNRGTIEAADILYGVSMAGDGTSQLLSLQVEAH